MSDYERVVEAVKAAKQHFDDSNQLTTDHIENVAEYAVYRFVTYLLEALVERA